MPISINTNYAASAASKNLALSNSMLQRSLNRLSSGSRIVNPNDDAGGLAVSMRLSATAKRSGSAATNLNNAVSLLQNQDGVLKVGGRILERMSELQSLWNDTTKNDQDRALYDVEFAALRSSLTSLGAEKFNGVSLFGTTATNIITTADGEQTCTISAKGLGVTGVAGTTSTLTGAAAPANPVGAAGDITIGGKTVSVSTADTLAGVITKINAISGITVVASSDGGKLKLTNLTSGTSAIAVAGADAALAALKIKPSDTPVAVTGTADTRDKAQLVLQATSLGNTNVASSGLSLNTVLTDAMNEMAKYRAANGAEQNGIGFATELLNVNKLNLEAATGRIVDVDVAEESTQLARWTTLTQAGTAMLAQANQANSLVLRLLGGQ